MTISAKSWDRAINMVKNVDEFDAPFLALTLELNAFLWTGDKKLISGLRKLKFEGVVETHQILTMIDN